MATRVYHKTWDGYSTGNLPEDDWERDGSHGFMQVVTSAADGGPAPRNGKSKMLRGQWTSSAYESAVKSFGSLHTNEFLLRTWFRMDQNMRQNDMVSGAHFARFLNSPPNQEILCSIPDWPGVAIAVQVNGTEPANNTFFAVPNQTQWAKLEYYCLRSSGSGIVRVWVNDALEFEYTSYNFGSARFNDFYLTSNWSSDVASGSNNFIYYDEFEFFSDQAGGDACTGTMSDASIEASGGGDVTAPTLSSADDGTPNSSGTVGASVSTDEGNGTLYWAVVTNGGSCTDAQLKAGSGGSIVSGKAGSQSVSGTGTQVISTITGLSASTTYQIKFLQTDSSANDSSQASVSLTTSAAGALALFLR